jgi:N-acetylmuramoyl-L-alanine amidase
MARISCVDAPSPNFDARGADQPVDILLIHYTGMQTGAAAIARLTDEASRVSAHYTVDEDGTIYAHVPEDQRAWHAGKSYWAGTVDVNARSIGIEIVNPGHEFGYRSFPDAQIAAVIELSLDILSRHAVPPERVLGHSDVAPARKQDPGELFPWQTLAQAGIGLWIPSPPQGERVRKRVRERGPQGSAPSFEGMLRRFGYGVRPDADVSLEDATVAFQRHFRPRDIGGLADAECEAIMAALLATLDWNPR